MKYLIYDTEVKQWSEPVELEDVTFHFNSPDALPVPIGIAWLKASPERFKPCMFTGLKDIYGKPIIEGHVVYLAGYGKYTAEFPFTELYEAVLEQDIGAITGHILENDPQGRVVEGE